MNDASLIPTDGLRRYLDDTFGPSDAAIELSRLQGHSNLTFLVRRGSDEWVLRRPPRGDIQPGTHEMHREYAVMDAIAGAGMPVPVPRPVALCRDDGYIGAPFYLMSLVDGLVVREAVPDAFDAPEHRRAMGLDLADRLADIHSLDWRAIGLESLARKPEGFLERNLRRMQQLYDAVRHREVTEIDEAGAWLREHAPEQRDVTLTHGDYKLDNVMFSREAPPRIVAIVDWEIATIGDPLVDLGWMLYFSPEPGDPETGSGDRAGFAEAALVAGEVSREPGYPTRTELARRYAQRTGRSLEDLRFYVAMAGWKIAIIMEGSNLRHKQGDADDPMFEMLDAAVPALAAKALAVVDGEIAV